MRVLITEEEATSRTMILRYAVERCDHEYLATGEFFRRRITEHVRRWMLVNSEPGKQR